MFINNNKLTFVRSERIQGVSQKNGKDYDIGTITISDGLESIKLPLDTKLFNVEHFLNLRKGDNVTVVIDAEEQYNRVNFVVISVTIAK